MRTEFTETCPLANWCPAILSFQTGMDAILLYYRCLSVCGLLQSPSSVPVKAAKVSVSPVASQCGAVSTTFAQWCSSVGENCQRFSSGIPMWGSFKYVFPVVFKCTLGQPVAFKWHSSVHWASQCTLSQGKGSETNTRIL